MEMALRKQTVHTYTWNVDERKSRLRVANMYRVEGNNLLRLDLYVPNM